MGKISRRKGEEEMSCSEKDISPNDINSLYGTYWTYKYYYNYYWLHKGDKTITKEDIEKELKNVYENRRPLAGPIEALCFFAQVPKSKLFNPNGTPKDINYIEALEMIKEANYGETND